MPVRVEVGLDGAKIVSTACGGDHSAAVTERTAPSTPGEKDHSCLGKPKDRPAGGTTTSEPGQARAHPR